MMVRPAAVSLERGAAVGRAADAVPEAVPRRRLCRTGRATRRSSRRRSRSAATCVELTGQGYRLELDDLDSAPIRRELGIPPGDVV